MQVHDSYIVAESDEGLIIVDQHALHERILFEELSRRLASGVLASQQQLIPVAIDVTESEAALLDEHASLLAQLGLELTAFGPRSVAVQKFPSLLAERNVAPEEFLRDLLDLLSEPGRDVEQVLEKLLATISCKAAVKAGQRLTYDEMAALLARRADAAKASACPHGRPTTLTLSVADLARQFKLT
jgi:DNA mismatch repair protein MutL